MKTDEDYDMDEKKKKDNMKVLEEISSRAKEKTSSDIPWECVVSSKGGREE